MKNNFYERDPIKETFYHSKLWRDCRNAYAKNVGWICERCKNRNVNYEKRDKEYFKQFIVHHKIYLTDENINDYSISLGFNNLELLCKACHNKEHYADPVCADELELVNGILKKKSKTNKE